MFIFAGTVKLLSFRSATPIVIKLKSGSETALYSLFPDPGTKDRLVYNKEQFMYETYKEEKIYLKTGSDKRLLSEDTRSVLIFWKMKMEIRQI